MGNISTTLPMMGCLALGSSEPTPFPASVILESCLLSSLSGGHGSGLTEKGKNMTTQHIVFSSDVLDLSQIDKWEDVFDTIEEAQSEASRRAAEGYGVNPWYVHEVTSRAVFKATPVRTVSTEVM